MNFFSRTPIEGKQRPLAGRWGNQDDFSSYGRNYDLEISQVPIRDAFKARQLIEAYEYCPEIATAINEINDSIWSSADGDDIGFAIAETLDDNETPIDPGIKDTLQRLIDEVIGGGTLEGSGERMLAYGDAFLNVGINFKKSQIDRVMFLPTWEIFRIETNDGQLLGFEQRRGLTDQDPIRFHPLAMVHWRFRKQTLYGRALFYEVVEDWLRLREISNDIAAAARAIGVNPNIHEMPTCADEKYRAEYKKLYEERKREGTVTDFYLSNGANIRKLATTNPDIKALLDAAEFRIERIVRRSRVPPWLMGRPSLGAREISNAPERAYARFINRCRMNISSGIRYLCNIELALKGYSREQWKYRIIWPKFYISPFAEQSDPQADEQNVEGIEDLD